MISSNQPVSRFNAGIRSVSHTRSLIMKENRIHDSIGESSAEKCRGACHIQDEEPSATHKKAAGNMPDTIRALVTILEAGMGNCAQRALSVALKKKLFDAIGDDGAALSGLAQALQCEERPARILADLLVALGLLDSREERYHLRPEMRELLVSTGGKYIGGFILMLDDRLYQAWASLESALMRNAPLSGFPPGPVLSTEETDSIIRKAMMGLHGFTAVTTSMVGEVISLQPGSTHLDLGGGTGALSIELAKRFPDVSFAMMDLAPVLKVAAGNIEKAGLISRIKLIEGDFFTAPYPEGISSISFSNVLQDWSKEKRAHLLSRAFDALQPGGLIVIVECMLDEGHNGPLLSAIMSLNMFIETAGGESLSALEYAAMLSEIGFSRIEAVSTFMPFGIVKAYR